MDILSQGLFKMTGRCLLVWMLFVCLQFSSTEPKGQDIMCSIPDPSHFPLKYHQKGELIIGAIMSQFGCLFEDISFDEHPKTKLIEELM